MTLFSDTTNTMAKLNNGVLDLLCPRKFIFTSEVACNMFQAGSIIKYERQNNHAFKMGGGALQKLANLFASRRQGS